jgi:hypothetical protein
MQCLLVEAESFTELGGWVVDGQFMDQMGSPFLMAHGLGQPVADATTTVTLPTPGAYRVWVRTRDWIAPHGPGQFRVRLNDTPLATLFGVGGDGAWRWANGGKVEFADTRLTLALEDLTGFNGRCDAILLVKDAPDGFCPPEDGETLTEFRRHLLGLPPTPPDAGAFDFVVAGGGYAGVCAAIAAARGGLHVAFIHNRPVLGGNASSDVRVTPIGGIHAGPYPRNADIIAQLQQTPRGLAGSGGIRACPDDDYVLALVRAEPNIALFLETHVYAVEREGERIIALRACHTRTSQEWRFPALLFADCTGDAQVGVLAGADWTSGREGRETTDESLAPAVGDTQLLGVSNFWLADFTGEATCFSPCPGALAIATDEAMEVSPPKWPPHFGDHAYAAGWNWETGFTMDQINDAEMVRDHNLRAIFGAWDYLKNRSPQRANYATAVLSWIGYIMGKRESRRLLGDLILTQHDLERPNHYQDGCVAATWYFDLHFPHPDNTRHFPGREFRSLAYDDPNFELLCGEITGAYTEIAPYPLPYRCLYARSLANLFMAGRNISVTHVALAPVRVMNTTAMMGTVVGRAAALCRTLAATPRELYTTHLAALKEMLEAPAEG